MRQELEIQKQNLEKAIQDPNTTSKDIINIAKKLDNLIIEIYNTEKKYEKILNRKDKQIIITQIKSDILDAHSDISIFELEMLSNNIYDFCCLTIHQISDTDINRYFSYKNRLYSKKISDNQLKKMIPTNFAELKKLSEKYIKLLKSNKESN